MHAETRTSVLDGSTRNLVDPTAAAATATDSASGVSAATCSIDVLHDQTASRRQPTIRCSIAAPEPATTLVRRVTVSSTTRRPTDPVNRPRPTDSSRLTLTPAT